MRTWKDNIVLRVKANGTILLCGLHSKWLHFKCEDYAFEITSQFVEVINGETFDHM